MVYKVLKYCFEHPVKTTLIAVASIGTPLLLLMIIMMVVISTVTSVPQSSGNCNSGGDEMSESISGASGTWTKKGTKLYNLNKQVFFDAKKLGYDDEHAAAIVGNSTNEGAGDLNANASLTFGQVGGGGGKGIFQFTSSPPKYGYGSVMAELKSILLFGAGSSFKGMHGSIADLTTFFVNKVEAAGTPRTSQRISSAEKAYQMWGHSGGSADSDASGTAMSSNSSCNNVSGGASNSKIVNIAKELDKKFHGGHYGGSSVAEFDRSGVGVCSTFVSAVLQKAGYGQMASLWCPTIVSKIANGHKFGNLQGISASQAEPGDIVVEHGHIMILESKWYGKHSSKTRVIDMRGDPGIHDNETYSYADFSDLGNTPQFAKAV